MFGRFENISNRTEALRIFSGAFYFGIYQSVSLSNNLLISGGNVLKKEQTNINKPNHIGKIKKGDKELFWMDFIRRFHDDLGNCHLFGTDLAQSFKILRTDTICLQIAKTRNLCGSWLCERRSRDSNPG